jgi:hypothetical protein
MLSRLADHPDRLTASEIASSLGIRVYTIGIGTKGGIVDKIVYKEELTPLGKKVIKKIIIKEPFIDKNKKISFRYIELTMGEK